MKVLLMRPKSKIRIKSLPLGLISLSSYLKRQFKDINIKMLDNRLLGYPEGRLLEKINGFDPDVIGISALLIEAQETHRIAKAIKNGRPKRALVVGGAYASSAAGWVMEDENIDFAVRGEGELTFAEFIGRIKDGKEVSALEGLSYRDNNTILHNPGRKPIEELDRLPHPDLDILNLEDYMSHIYGNSHNILQADRRCLPVMTSRGCTFECIYCHNFLGKRYRVHSPGYVMDYIKMLTGKYNVKEIQIIDDSFNLDISRAKDIMRLIIDSGIKINISFPNGIRTDLLDDELIDLFEKAGVFRVIFGIESGNQEMQKLIRKNLDLRLARENIIKAAKRKMQLSAFFMFGFPGETEAEIRDTIDYACSLPIHVASFHYAIPFPGTGLEKFVPSGINLKDFFLNFSPDFHRSIINLSKVPSARLPHLKKIAVWRFYFKFSRIVANLKVFKDIKAFKSKYLLFRNFLTVLKWAFTEWR